MSEVLVHILLWWGNCYFNVSYKMSIFKTFYKIMKKKMFIDKLIAGFFTSKNYCRHICAIYDEDDMHKILLHSVGIYFSIRLFSP